MHEHRAVACAPHGVRLQPRARANFRTQTERHLHARPYLPCSLSLWHSGQRSLPAQGVCPQTFLTSAWQRWPSCPAPSPSSRRSAFSGGKLPNLVQDEPSESSLRRGLLWASPCRAPASFHCDRKSAPFAQSQRAPTPSPHSRMHPNRNSGRPVSCAWTFRPDRPRACASSWIVANASCAANDSLPQPLCTQPTRTSPHDTAPKA